MYVNLLHLQSVVAAFTVTAGFYKPKLEKEAIRYDFKYFLFFRRARVPGESLKKTVRSTMLLRVV